MSRVRGLRDLARVLWLLMVASIIGCASEQAEYAASFLLDGDRVELPHYALPGLEYDEFWEAYTCLFVEEASSDRQLSLYFPVKVEATGGASGSTISWCEDCPSCDLGFDCFDSTNATVVITTVTEEVVEGTFSGSLEGGYEIANGSFMIPNAQ